MSRNILVVSDHFLLSITLGRKKLCFELKTFVGEKLLNLLKFVVPIFFLKTVLLWKKKTDLFKENILFQKSVWR